jgi:manganese efflux pump family protein
MIVSPDRLGLDELHNYIRYNTKFVAWMLIDDDRFSPGNSILAGVEIFTVLAVAIGLAMDSFAVSLGVGTAGRANDLRSKVRLAFHLSIFQSLFTVLGWLAGHTLTRFISGFDHWIAFALLAYVGGKMIWSGLHPAEGQYDHIDPSRGRMMIVLSIATSIDAMAVGLSMAMIHEPVLLPAVVIGLVTFILSSLGVSVGNRLEATFGKKMEIVGGLILIVIGVRILISHLFGGGG